LPQLAWSRPDLGMIKIALLHVALRLKEQAKVGTETEVGTDFGQEGCEVVSAAEGTISAKAKTAASVIFISPRVPISMRRHWLPFQRAHQGTYL
jgi:hypothetical protein